MSLLTDAECMQQTLALAVRVKHSIAPNPRVGCIIVAEDRIVGSGFHRGPGLDHAETVALNRAGEQARGATLFVNLEPCNHLGCTPPCTESIIRHGIRRVVAAMHDPDPRVDGSGFETLRQAGIHVDVGLLESAAQRINSGFATLHRTGRPEVTLKAALSADGMLAVQSGVSRWISNAESRSFVHRLRVEHDAILVGAGTVRVDDPRLTARCGTEGHDPLPVIVTSGLDISPAAKLFEGSRKPLIYGLVGTGPEQIARLPRGEIVLLDRSSADEKRIDLDQLLKDLGRRGVQRLLVEGGGHVNGSFISERRVNRIVAFTAPTIVGAQGGVPWVDAPAVDAPENGLRVTRRYTMTLGDDLVLIGECKSAEQVR